jgi:hypothetical protein
VNDLSAFEAAALDKLKPSFINAVNDYIDLLKKAGK